MVFFPFEESYSLRPITASYGQVLDSSIYVMVEVGQVVVVDHLSFFRPCILGTLSVV